MTIVVCRGASGRFGAGRHPHTPSPHVATAALVQLTMGTTVSHNGYQNQKPNAMRSGVGLDDANVITELEDASSFVFGANPACGAALDGLRVGDTRDSNL